MIRPVSRSTARIRSSCSPQEPGQLGRQVHDAALVVLGGPWVEAQAAPLEVELPALQPEDLLDPPAVGVGDRHGHLEVGLQSAAHRLIGRPLEEAGSG
jgi:hypothetical protein